MGSEITQRACIYNVSEDIRAANLHAYTPQMLLIGPLNRAKKFKPKDSDMEHPQGHLKKKKGEKYKPMEVVKDTYLEAFTKRVGGAVVDEIKNAIEAEDVNIRASYHNKGVIEQMKPEFFKELILKDSVFIMEFIARLRNARGTSTSSDSIVEDTIVNSLGKKASVIADLILLENQLPYFIFDKLFGPHLPKMFSSYTTINELFLELFSLNTKIKRNKNFMHFTDMFRCAYEESLDDSLEIGPAITEMQNADKLSRVGVKFKALNMLNSSKQDEIQRCKQPLDSLPTSIRNEKDEYSLHVEFNEGCLVMSRFHASEASERILRNVIAYEHHHGLTPLTSNYIHFLNFLITTKEDVDVLIEEGVLNAMGPPINVVNMVNSLKTGLTEADTSQYQNIARKLKVYGKSRTRRCWTTLKKVYFTDLLTGTATTAAVFMLIMTLIGTVASVIQAYTSLYPPTSPSSSTL